jgi:D-proline reductase (dithiol) PrdB
LEGESVSLTRFKNRAIAKIITAFPSLSRRLIESYHPWESEDIPWTPVTKPLSESTLALVTTAGVHHKDQKPFDMKDPNGDPSYRIIDGTRPPSSLMITHDYYDHSDADRDINIVLPLDRLREMAAEGTIGALAEQHFSFMGHIDGPHITTLIEKTGREVAHFLREEGADVVLLTPG